MTFGHANSDLLMLTDPFKEFRESVTPDIYEVSSYIDWKGIENRLKQFSSAITYLQHASDTNTISADYIAAGLHEEPYLYEAITTLLAIPRGVGFDDGRELPDPISRPLTKHEVVATLLVEIGILHLLNPPVNVRNLMKAALTAQDGIKRRYRVGPTINKKLEQIVFSAVESANRDYELLIYTLPRNLWPQVAKGRVEYVLAIEGRPAIAIALVFQTASGGRQQRDLSVNYPNLQMQLAEQGLSLILIADGRGIREAQPRVLEALFTGVAACMTIRQATDGVLQKEIRRLTTGNIPLESRPVNRIISLSLQSRGKVSAEELPLNYDRARLALAAFVEANNELALLLTDGSSMVKWKREELVKLASNLVENFDPAIAISCFSQLMQTLVTEDLEKSETITYSVHTILRSDSILPKRLLVTASTLSPEPTLFRAVANKALTIVSDSKTSVLLTPQSPDPTRSSTLRTLQRTLTSNVIVLSSTDILEMAQSVQIPQTLLARHLLAQSDLVKASPYVVNSVTPETMFFGRESEEALLISRLASNSVALLGGRRIGKTSLMRHVEAKLRDAGYITYFGDCQTVRDWNDFAKMARRIWQSSVNIPFDANELFSLVDQLKYNNDSKVVFLLDEIDQLLEWDKKHSGKEVPEAFFRACRTISQESKAQFVFSGERIISKKLWDPHSPHWNFCQPLMLRQLDQLSSKHLIIDPLKNLQITIEDEIKFADIAWSRTNGHPQLLQTLGDKLMRILNERIPENRLLVSTNDLAEVADTYSFAESYLETYWGQSTSLERLISLLVEMRVETIGDIRNFLRNKGFSIDESSIRSALRMLELYGIVEPIASGYTLQLQWFSSALQFYGGRDNLISQYLEART